MATAIDNRLARTSTEIKLDPGVPQVFALKYVTGKNLGNSQYPPFMPRVLFTAVDNRKLWMDAEEASAFELRLRELRVQPADFIRVLRVRRGGEIHVELAEESKLERELMQSLDAGDERKRAARATTSTPRRAPGAAARALTEQEAYELGLSSERGAGTGSTAPATEEHYNNSPNHTADPATAPGAARITPAAARLCASFMAAIDAVGEAQTYADRRGLKITFTSEDVRSTAISCYISACREGDRA